MLGTYSYNGVIKKIVIAFGTLFNNIQIKKLDENQNIVTIKIPIAYSSRQKFLARLEQSPNLVQKFEITLPRLAFQMTGISYDSSRKVAAVQKYINTESGKVLTQFMPVPYNINFELNIFTKTNEDYLQIIEQILPYFRPAFNVSVDMIVDMNETRDIPIVLNNITQQDDFEGGFDQRRILITTLNFTAKSYIYGPIEEDIQKLIRKIQIDTYAIGIGNTSGRVRRYIVEPNPIDAQPGDDFGFTETIIEP